MVTLEHKRRVRKTAQMKLVEHQHKACCNRTIDDIILTALQRRKGRLDKTADELRISPSTIGRWVTVLDIEAEVDVIRVTNGYSARYIQGEINDQSKVWQRVSASVSGPCVECEREHEGLGNLWCTGAATVHGEMLITVRDVSGIGHQFPVDIDVYNSSVTDDHRIER